MENEAIWIAGTLGVLYRIWRFRIKAPPLWLKLAAGACTVCLTASFLPVPKDSYLTLAAVFLSVQSKIIPNE